MSLHLVANHITPITVLDIGANVGAWGLEARRIWPDCWVTMIEGNPECEEHLKKTNLAYKMALLSSSRGKRKFFTNKNNPACTGASMYREKTPFYDGENAVEVELETHTLDELFPKGAFDFIKIDVQGAELDVMKGGRRLMRMANAILIELSIVEYNEGAPMADQVEKYCRSIGFNKKLDIQNIIHPIEREKIVQIDTLFLR